MSLCLIAGCHCVNYFPSFQLQIGGYQYKLAALFQVELLAENFLRGIELNLSYHKVYSSASPPLASKGCILTTFLVPFFQLLCGNQVPLDLLILTGRKASKNPPAPQRNLIKIKWITPKYVQIPA